METIKQLLEGSATAVEIFTVVMILVVGSLGTLRFFLQLSRRQSDAYKNYRQHLGKMLILALELLVAADIIRTVVLEQTLQDILILGLLVLIRTFLSWSLSVEIEGRWPWAGDQSKPASEVTQQ